MSRVALALTLGALCGAACSPNREDAQATVTVVVPSQHWWMWNLSSHAPVFLSLFHEHDGQPEGRLVRRWEQHADGRTWTYHLRTDVRWHDGVPVTAHDVKFTLDLLTHPELLHLPPGAAIPTVIDDSTVSIRFTMVGDRRWNPLESSIPVYPKHRLADLDPRDFFEWDFWDAPVGNGPYRVARSVPRFMVELEANPDFYRGAPRIERVVLMLQGGMPRIDLQAGTVDLADAFVLQPADAFDLARESRFDAYWTFGTWMYAIVWNQRNPILQDINVRRALTSAIDRREIAAVLWIPPDAPWVDVPTTARQRALGDLPAPVETDLQRSAALLEQAGWTDRDGDGVRERDGVPLRFELLTREADLAVLLQSQFRRIGAVVDVISMPGKDRELVEAGEFDAMFNGGIGTRSDALRHFLVDLPGSGEGSRLSQLLTTLDTVVDPVARDRLYADLWAIVRRDLPATFVLPNLWVSVANARVRGLTSPGRAIATEHLDELWIEE